MKEIFLLLLAGSKSSGSELKLLKLLGNKLLVEKSYGVIAWRAWKGFFQGFSILAVRDIFRSVLFRTVCLVSGLSGGNWSLSPCNILSLVFPRLWFLNTSSLFFLFCIFSSFLFGIYLKTQCPQNDTVLLLSSMTTAH